MAWVSCGQPFHGKISTCKPIAKERITVMQWGDWQMKENWWKWLLPFSPSLWNFQRELFYQFFLSTIYCYLLIILSTSSPHKKLKKMKTIFSSLKVLFEVLFFHTSPPVTKISESQDRCRLIWRKTYILKYKVVIWA